MGAKAGIALKTVQWFLRAIQFASSALILGIYSYFLATLHNHALPITASLRAVEGISGAALLYTLIALCLLCCLAGIFPIAVIAITLDIAFLGAFIYVAIANRHGAGSCNGPDVKTPFGSGPGGEKPHSGTNGFTALPTFRTACRLQTACLSVAIVAIIFFLLSAMMEIFLARHHRKEKRFGPSPANDYTYGYGSSSNNSKDKSNSGGGNFISRIFRRGKGPADGAAAGAVINENALPAHTTPAQLDPNQNGQSYGTTMASDYLSPLDNQNITTTGSNDNTKYETGYGGGYTSPIPGAATRTGGYQAPPVSYRYVDGVYDPVEVPATNYRAEFP